MENKGKSFLSVLQSKHTQKIIIIAGIIGIVIIFLSTLTDFDSSKQQADDTINTVDTYCQTLQANLSNIIESIEGVGKASVLITMENSTESIYLENNETKTKEIEPTVRGVVVVCQGGENPVVVSRVIAAVTKSLNISSSKVCVTKLDQSKVTVQQ